jgi:hypothetical protein
VEFRGDEVTACIKLGEIIMFQRITSFDFIDAFRAHGREKQFSYEAKKALFEYLEGLEEDTGEPVELDVVALCCDYQESSVDDIIKDYGLDASSCKDDEERRELVEKFLNDRTNVIWHDGDVFLFQQF